MRIAVDAMGGDHAPHAIVEGANLALQEYKDIEIILVGDETKIKQSLPSTRQKRMHIKHASEVISAEEEPVRAVRRKKDASLVRIAAMLKQKDADAIISAGNTGAYMTAALLVTGRMKGIERPALAAFMPTAQGDMSLVLDVGANVDAKPNHLLQYALMGSIYAQKIMNHPRPSVGLLNIGTEDLKGNELVKQTFPLLKQHEGLHFIGNVEARTVPFHAAQVIVCDGFVGNVLLKLTEGVAEALFSMLKKEMTKNMATKMAASILKPGFKQMKNSLDYSEYGGAPLLGIDGVCIKAHGSSNALAIKNSIRQARSMVEEDVISFIKEEVMKESERE